MKKKRKIPWFMRRRESCPDCGWTTMENDVWERMEKAGQFTCPRCKSIFGWGDFCRENYQKYELTMEEES